MSEYAVENGNFLFFKGAGGGVCPKLFCLVFVLYEPFPKRKDAMGRKRKTNVRINKKTMKKVKEENLKKKQKICNEHINLSHPIDRTSQFAEWCGNPPLLEQFCQITPQKRKKGIFPSKCNWGSPPTHPPRAFICINWNLNCIFQLYRIDAVAHHLFVWIQTMKIC